jgi:hypothetical protein
MIISTRARLPSVLTATKPNYPIRPARIVATIVGAKQSWWKNQPEVESGNLCGLPSVPMSPVALGATY